MLPGEPAAPERHSLPCEPVRADATQRSSYRDIPLQCHRHRPALWSQVHAVTPPPAQSPPRAPSSPARPDGRPASLPRSSAAGAFQRQAPTHINPPPIAKPHLLRVPPTSALCCGSASASPTCSEARRRQSCPAPAPRPPCPAPAPPHLPQRRLRGCQPAEATPAAPDWGGRGEEAAAAAACLAWRLPQSRLLRAGKSPRS